MVGRRWLIDVEGNRRLGGKDDRVRRELRWGLENNLRVVPILLDGARMPDAKSLPRPLKSFSKHQAISVRSDAEFNRNVEYLIDELTNLSASLRQQGNARK